MLNSDKNPLVSVIVPVYNMQELLPKCLNSILQQTYPTIELVIVDDGSSDRSGKIADEYAKNDNRVIVVHQKNGGIACAINSGLDRIQGEYFMFVDSDDYIGPEMVKRLLEVMVNNEADIVQCGRYSFPNKNGIGIIPQQKQDLVIFDSREKILDDFFHHKRISRNLAARLYKTSLFVGIRCEPGRQTIDSVTLPRVLVKCNKYVFIEEKHYYVYESPTSESRGKYTMKKWDDCKFGNNFIEGFINENCPEYISYAYYKYVYTSVFAFCVVDGNKKETGRDVIMEECLNFFKKYYPILLKTDYYRSVTSSKRKSFKWFNRMPFLYSKIYRCKRGLLRRLRIIKYN